MNLLTMVELPCQHAEWWPTMPIHSAVKRYAFDELESGSLPARTRRRIHEISCNKYAPNRITHSPGLFAVVCAFTKRIVGFSLMETVESPTTAFEVLVTRM